MMDIFSGAPESYLIRLQPLGYFDVAGRSDAALNNQRFFFFFHFLFSVALNLAVLIRQGRC